MLIQNMNSSNQVAAPPPSRPASDGAPASVVVATNAPVDVKFAKQVDTAPPPPAAKPAAVQPTNMELKNLVDGINRALKQANKSLEFSVDSDTKKTVVKLIDSESGDVIRQFPTDEMLALSKAIGQLQEQLQQAALAKTPTPGTPSLLVKQQA
ncbi:MAG: flagellar protein FlaG [Gallionella sp.]